MSSDRIPHQRSPYFQIIIIQFSYTAIYFIPVGLPGQNYLSTSVFLDVLAGRSGKILKLIIFDAYTTGDKLQGVPAISNSTAYFPHNPSD